MNFANILKHVAETDPEIYERLSPRRKVIRNFARTASLTALPFALGSLFKKAYGQTNPIPVLEVLNFALTLEYLESEFYKKALSYSVGPVAPDPLIPSGLEQQAIIGIGEHEKRHVTFLRETIQGLGSIPMDSPKFDFTAGGIYPTVFDEYDAFLAVAQTLEDTGVRAYKGGIDILSERADILQAALRIHSLEARHAAQIRSMRRNYPSILISGDIMPWVTGNESNISGPNDDIQLAYSKENNTEQVRIQIVGINGQAFVDEASATEAFDEPLAPTDVMKIAGKFIVP
jgi:hypothetical protein